MRYIKMNGVGDPSVLVMAEMEAPVPKEDQILIGVAYAGVNRPDIFQRQGSYPVPPGASPILGLEVSGRVLAVGSGVRRFEVGDSVCALTNGGGYAEQVCVDEGQCLPVPDGITQARAAALPETCFTVWYNVFDRAHLQRGESLLVHGGASGIGTTAIQMAKSMGCRVFVTASSADKCRACLELGADGAINYNEEDFVTRVPELNGGKGPDVILDMVGGDYINRNIQVAAVDGRIVNIAFLRGAKVNVNYMPVMLKRLTLTGSTLRPLSAEIKQSIAAELQQQIWPQVASGAIQPKIEREYSLQQAAEAHRLLEGNGVIGKVILKIGAEK